MKKFQIMDLHIDKVNLSPPKSDLVDTFQLLKSYLDFKLVDLKQDLVSEQDNFTQKV